MSDNKNILVVELRGIGNNYGKIIQARLISLNIELPDGTVEEYAVSDGFVADGERDGDIVPEYTDYQLNLDSLKFAQSVILDNAEG